MHILQNRMNELTEKENDIEIGAGVDYSISVG